VNLVCFADSAIQISAITAAKKPKEIDLIGFLKANPSLL
jgi:hypothetical protein